MDSFRFLVDPAKHLDTASLAAASLPMAVSTALHAFGQAPHARGDCRHGGYPTGTALFWQGVTRVFANRLGLHAARD